MKKAIATMLVMLVLSIAMVSATPHPSKDVVEPEKVRVGHTREYYNCLWELGSHIVKGRDNVKNAWDKCLALDYQ